MLIPLENAEVDTCGGKAAGLGAMLRAGLPVPDGFVVPLTAYRTAVRDREQSGSFGSVLAATSSLRRDGALPRPLRTALESALARLGPGAVAVRSSATGEDAGQASAAGQYDSTLAVDGAPAVAGAVRACWASLHSPRATAYRSRDRQGEACTEELAMAVVVQRHLDAEASGVLFTPTGPAGATSIESVWGLGPSVVAGTVTPDCYRIEADGTVRRRVADKRTRLDRVGPGLRTSQVADDSRRRPTLDDVTALGLADLGARVAVALGGPQDVEWAVADGRLWLLQARPITVAPPPAASPGSASYGSLTLVGTPGSSGTATGPAMVARGPAVFDRVRPGDILVCPFTDPAWTPLLRLVAGVVTETGGVLSHAAIVAREHGIPAVLGVPAAVTAIPDGATVTVDGAIGTVSIG